MPAARSISVNVSLTNIQCKPCFGKSRKSILDVRRDGGQITETLTSSLIAPGQLQIEIVLLHAVVMWVKSWQGLGVVKWLRPCSMGNV
jgi:hypothetical protein